MKITAKQMETLKALIVGGYPVESKPANPDSDTGWRQVGYDLHRTGQNTATLCSLKAKGLIDASQVFGGGQVSNLRVTDAGREAAASA